MYITEPFLGLPRLMVVGLSRLQTHGISRPALVSRGASSSVDRHVREGPTFFLYLCVSSAVFLYYFLYYFLYFSGVWATSERNGMGCHRTGALAGGG